MRPVGHKKGTQKMLVSTLLISVVALSVCYMQTYVIRCAKHVDLNEDFYEDSSDTE